MIYYILELLKYLFNYKKELPNNNSQLTYMTPIKYDNKNNIFDKLNRKNIKYKIKASSDNIILENKEIYKILVDFSCLLLSNDKKNYLEVYVQLLSKYDKKILKIVDKRTHKCIIYLDRSLLRFSENEINYEIAFTARNGEYDWWILRLNNSKNYLLFLYNIVLDCSM